MNNILLLEQDYDVLDIKEKEMRRFIGTRERSIPECQRQVDLPETVFGTPSSQVVASATLMRCFGFLTHETLFLKEYSSVSAVYFPPVDVTGVSSVTSRATSKMCRINDDVLAVGDDSVTITIVIS